MAQYLNRRSFLGLVPGGVALASGSLVIAGPSDGGDSETPGLHAEFPSQDPALVRDVVGSSHARIERVRELVTASPALAKAAWDWGFGDWETALGAASHMGRRDIAELLIEHGARPNLFTHAMLGHLEVVKAAVAAEPGIQVIPGPHGITLLQHAKNGGEASKSVAAYLESVGGADERAVSLEVSEEQQRLYVGRYEFGRGANDAFDVLTNRGGNLAIKRGDRFSRVLNRVEEHGFAPGGAPAVRVRFAVEKEKTVSLTIHDPYPIVTALKQL